MDPLLQGSGKTTLDELSKGHARVFHDHPACDAHGGRVIIEDCPPHMLARLRQTYPWVRYWRPWFELVQLFSKEFFKLFQARDSDHYQVRSWQR